LDHLRPAGHLPLRLHAAPEGHGRRRDRPVTAAVLERDLVIVSCAISAGIHGALIREHVAEGAAAGAGFVAAAVLLGALVIALTQTIALLSALEALAVSGGHNAHAHGNPPSMPRATR